MASTLAGLREVFANISAKIGSYTTSLGMTGPEKDEVVLMCDTAVEAIDSVDQNEATSKAVVEWRNLVLKGTPVGDTAPAAPAFAAITLPPGATIGILAQFRDWRARWVSAPGYTQAIGEDLMIVRIGGEGIAPGSVQPTIKVFAAQSGYLFSIVVEGREEADQWIVEIRTMPDGAWTNAGTFTGKSTDVSVTPPESAMPLQVQVRVQLRKSNANYGQLSQIATVTVNP